MSCFVDWEWEGRPIDDHNYSFRWYKCHNLQFTVRCEVVHELWLLAITKHLESPPILFVQILLGQFIRRYHRLYLQKSSFFFSIHTWRILCREKASLFQTSGGGGGGVKPPNPLDPPLVLYVWGACNVSLWSLHSALSGRNKKSLGRGMKEMGMTIKTRKKMVRLIILMWEIVWILLKAPCSIIKSVEMVSAAKQY